MLRLSLFTILLRFGAFALSIQDDDGYIGYKLDIRQDGDPLAVGYETQNTSNNVSTTVPKPDVFLNASVSVGEIRIEVDDLSAKINLDAEVLQLLSFNAGVDLSIDRVNLLIQDVVAKVVLEARLSNLVMMIDDVLNSVDLNPIIAELGSGLGTILGDTTNLIGDLSTERTQPTKRDLSLSQHELTNNILYAINDFSGSTHTNRVLAQNGDIIDQSLNNNGVISGTKVVGNYEQDMRFNGFNMTVTYRGQEVWEEEWVYAPYSGLMAISAVFKNKATGAVVGTQIIAEARGGGEASVASKQET